MQKATRVLALALFVMLLVIPFGARAQGSLTASATISPEALTEAGKVDIKLKLTNTSDQMLEDVTMVARGINETLGNFDPNTTRSFTISNYKILEEELGSYVAFSFVWYENGVMQTLQYNIDIPIKTAEPALTAERTVSANSGKAGDVITVTYALQNTGETPLYDVTISDPAVTEEISVGDLPIGSDVVRITREVTLTDVNITSAPVITASSTTLPLNISLEPVEIMLTDARLELTVVPGTPTADGTPVTITVKNPGNVDFDSVALLDENGAALTSAFGLAMGDTKEITATVLVTDARELTVTATATYGTNTPVIVTSEPVTLEPYISASEIVVTLIAKPVKSEFDEPSEVAFAVRIDNDSPVELYNMRIYEDTEGLLTTIDTVQQGTQTVNVKILITEPRELHFYAAYEDENGNSYQKEASPVTITINALNGTSDPNESIGADDGSGGSWLKWVLLIIAVLLLAAAASLIYMLAQGRRRREQEREAEELDRLLAARQEKHRTERITKISDSELDRRTNAPLRPRIDDLTIGDIPTNHPKRAEVSRQPEAPKQAPQQSQTPPQPQAPKTDLDDLFEDEFK